MHLLLVGISHRTAPVELRERVDFQARGVDRRAARAGGARIDARGGRAVDLQPRRAVRRVRRRRRRRARIWSRFVSEFHGVDRRRRRAARLRRRRPRRGAPSVPRRRRPRLAGRRRAADSRPGEGRAHGRQPTRRPSGRCSTGCSTRRSPSASACAPKPDSARARCRSATPRSRSRERSSATSTGRSVAGHRRRRDGQAHRAAHEVAGRAARDDRQPHDGARGADGGSDRRRERPRRGTSWTRVLGASDIVITATGAAAPILTKAHIEAVMRPRRNRPLFIIDIADAARRRAGGRRDRAGVPLQHRRSAGDRAREPRAPRQRGRARRSDRRRRGRASSARWLRSRGAIPTVVALRQRFEAIRRAELERLDFKLSTLPPEARARVDEITRLIVEKLLLTPTEQLKALGDADTVGAYSEALTRLFGLSRAGDAERAARTRTGRRRRASAASSRSRAASRDADR